MSIKSNILGKRYSSGSLEKLLYLSDGLTMPLMYDGIDVVNWGVYAPTTTPAVAATSTGANSLDLCEQLWTSASTTVDDGEDVWAIYSAVSNAVSIVSTDSKVGTYSTAILLGTSFIPLGATTKLMLHFDNNFTDSSVAAKVATVVGDATLTAAQSVFGGYAGLFDGTGDYIKYGLSDSDFQPGTGDFSIEFRARFNTFATGDAIFDFGRGRGGLAGIMMDCDTSSGNKLRLWINDTLVWTYSSTISTGTWYTIAITRSGTTLRVYANGTQNGTDITNSSDISSAFEFGASPVMIGGNNFTGSPVGNFDGWLDEFRYDKGLARYIGSAYVVPTEAYNSFSTLSNDPLGVYGLIAYEDLTPIDLSGYWGLEFWIKSDKALASGDAQLILFDSTGGSTELERITIPALPASTWTKVSAQFVTPALLTSIASIGLWVVVDKGVNIFYVDDVKAVRCKVSLDTSERVEGASAVKLEVPGNIPSGTLLAYRDFTTVDMTGDTVVLMSLRCDRAVGFQDLQYLLDNTSACASPIESIYVTDNLDANIWNNLTLDLATPASLGSVISNGLKIADRNLAPCTIWIDNIKRATSVSGNLSGRYFVWVSFYSSQYDRESDLSPVSAVIDTNGQGISVSSIPVSTDTQVDMRKIYRSAAGGTVPYLDSLIKDNTSTTLVLNKDDASLQAGSRHPSREEGSGKFQPPPACPYMVQFKNRFVLAGSLDYTRGTVTTSTLSPNFVFDKAEIDNSFIGRTIRISGQTEKYIIQSVNSGTKTAVARPIEDLETGTYKETGAAGLSYVISGNENTIYTSYIDDDNVPRPHGFPVDQQQDIIEGKANDRISGIGVIGDAFFVTKFHSVHILEGSSPPYANNKISDVIGCSSHRTIFQDESGKSFWLAGEAGIASTDGFKVDIISPGIIDLFNGRHALAFEPTMFSEAHAVYDTQEKLAYFFLASEGSSVNNCVLILDKSNPDATKWKWYYWTGIEAACSTITYDDNGVGTILIGDYDGFLSELNVGYVDCLTAAAALLTISGTPTAQGASTLTDSTATFYTTGSKLSGVPVILVNTLTGAFEIHTISTNTGTQITIEDTWSETPTVNHRYYIGAYEFQWQSKNFELARVTDKQVIFDTVCNHEQTSASNKLRIKVKKNLSGTTVVNQLVELNAGEENVLLVRQRLQQMQWELTGFCKNENIAINSVGIRFRPRGIR